MRTCRHADNSASNHARSGIFRTGNSSKVAAADVEARRPRESLCVYLGCSLESLLMIDILMQGVAKLLEVLFFAGTAGSLLVIAISAVEDIHTIFEKD